jgi:hypothetical protein
MPAYGPGAIINRSSRPTYGAAVSGLLDAIQGRQERESVLEMQRKQQEQAAREARVQGVMEDLKKVPASKLQEYIAQLPPDLQDDLRNRGRGLIKLPMTSEEYAEQRRIGDFTELGKLDPTDPRVRASAEARTYAYLTKRDLPPEQWQATMTGNLQGTAGLTEANRIANKQQVTANEAADNALAGRKFTEIEKPESLATIGRTNAETRKYGAEVGKVGAEVALLNARRDALQNPAADGGDSAEAIADAIVNGLQPPDTKGLYKLAGPVRAELAKRGYNLTTANLDWQATQRHVATLNGPQQTRLRQAVDASYHQLDVVEKLYQEWKQKGAVTGIRIFNRASLAAAKNLPGEAGAAAQALDGQIALLTGELGNTLMGGNSPTDHALTLASSMLASDWNEQTFTKGIQQLRTDLKIRQNSLQNSTPAGLSQPNAGADAPFSQNSAPRPPTAQQRPASDPLRIF